jgi:Ca2+-binding EF-hand superfamily protein
MMKQFDKNSDGELDETEREAMRSAMGARFDNRGGGGGPRLSPEEALKRFDKNNDGTLDDQERATMRESLGQRGGRSGSPKPREQGSTSPQADDKPKAAPAGE